MDTRRLVDVYNSTIVLMFLVKMKPQTYTHTVLSSNGDKETGGARPCFFSVLFVLSRYRYYMKINSGGQLL